MKTIIKISAIIMTTAMMCLVFAACGNKGNTDSAPTSNISYHSGKEYAAADYEDVKETIKYEDNKAMTKLMKDLTKGKYDNKVVEMEGTNTRYGTSCGILEKNDDGTLVGAMYYLIDSNFPTDYPEKGAHIKLKGLVVVDESNGSRHLEVPKDQLEILD